MERQGEATRKQDENINDNKKRVSDLKMVRSLNFTDAHYEEAIRRKGSAFDNPNQLLVALLDVSATSDSNNSVSNHSMRIKQHNQTNLSSDEVDMLEQFDCSDNFARNTKTTIGLPTIGQSRKSKLRATNSYGTTTTTATNSSSSISSVSSTSLHINAPNCGSCSGSSSSRNFSGLASAENQSSLECLMAEPASAAHNIIIQQHQQQQLNHHQMITCNSNNNIPFHFQRQKVQRSRSHQPTTTTTSTNYHYFNHQTTSPQTTDFLRIIYIDGPNVARTHGKDVSFSWKGIKLCVDWFRRRNHKVKVFVPLDKCDTYGEANLSTTTNIVHYLQQIDALIKTPVGCNDDMFIIEAARQSNGIMVSNDLFRNEKRSNTDLRRFISLNRLPYIFVDDLFIPANDPLGRTGPMLDEFLKFENTSAMISQQITHRQSLHRTKSHQRQ